MRWPWKKQEPEKRQQNQPYTDALTALIVEQAGGTLAGDAGQIAALEVCAGLYSRAFAGATVDAPDPIKAAVTPSTLALIGRDLIRRGESLHVIDVAGGAIVLQPAGSWDVRGQADKATWFYRADLFGPSGNVTRFVPGAQVIHAMYSVEPSRPYYGIGPLGWSRVTGQLAGALEQGLQYEAAASVGAFIPLPEASDEIDDPANDPQALLRADIRNAKGKRLLVETTSAGFAEGRQAAPAADWKQQRFGGEIPSSHVTLREQVQQSVYASCGVPPDLAMIGTAQGQREAWRRFVLGSVQPLANMLAGELSEKLSAGVSLSFPDAGAADLSGRASAFSKLVQGGMDVNQALAVTGLLAAAE